MKLNDETPATSMSVVLDEDMKRVVREQRLGFVASVCPDGTPNLSPKGTTAVWDDEHLVFAHIHSHQTVVNIEAGQAVVEINVVDPIVRKGYRFKGPATVHRDGQVYESGVRLYNERSGLERSRIEAVVLVRVELAEALISPAYDDGSTEQVVEKRSLKMYGLVRANAVPERAMRPGALAGIGRTPLIKLSSLPAEGDGEVWVKLEAANPTGSYKDRMALAMIEAAERRGTLLPGQTVVEYTGGSTGSSLAFVCAVKGYPLRIVTSNAFASEKLRTMAAFGATLEVIDSPNGIHPGLIPAMQVRAREIVEEEGAFPTDQFNNRDALDGYREIGDEILQELADRIDAACLYVGVGGCFVGVTEALRVRWPEMTRVIVEPAESAVIAGGPPGTHRIEGGGVGFIPPNITPDTYDRTAAVSTADAFASARRAASVEGVWTGPSGGANILTALRLARELGSGHRVVTVQPDSGMKYLSGDLYTSVTSSVSAR
ncbi:MAG TPA: pyridoxal-phosphate dependent enzyme [Ilumatobacteraceae bacterium]|nr:pyridoxal-phosphate dependent enzyme [Ilumatobacteraceae bacterium]